MRILFLIAMILSAPAFAFASGPALMRDPSARPPEVALDRDPLHCQSPALGFSANASTPFDSEIADDLPDSLVGRMFDEVTLYVAEWLHSEWVDPVGLIINFYDGECPPPMVPASACTFLWDELDVQLVDYSPPTRIVYAAVASLPSPVSITPYMSMGVQVTIDWDFEPYAGFLLTGPEDNKGCGEAYWDDASHGAPRWTALSASAGFASDLAFCLNESPTGMDKEREVSWGVMKKLFRP